MLSKTTYTLQKKWANNYVFCLKKNLYAINNWAFYF